MKKKFNIAVREAAYKHGLYVYQIAQIMGISESSLVKKMRTEWTEEEQLAVIQKINDFAKENNP